MNNVSSSFLIGYATDSTSELLKTYSRSAPIVVFDTPILFLSPPIDEDSVKLPSPETEYLFSIEGHRFLRNPQTNRSEFVLLMRAVDPTVLSDLDVDITHFYPYTVLALDPLRTSTIRLYLKNLADTLMTLGPLSFRLSLRQDTVLHDAYNPSLERDHDWSFSKSL